MAPKLPVGTCAFCEQEKSCFDAVGTHENKPHKWLVCDDHFCQQAAYAQFDRMYAGLVDCPETRRDALDWVRAS